jgi:hypothetical protein
MSSRLKFIIIAGSILTFTKLCVQRGEAQNENLAELEQRSSRIRLDGDVYLATDRFENGQTQTQNSWAFMTELKLNTGQMVIGLRGVNTKYPNNDSSLNLRPSLGIPIRLGADTELTLKYSLDRYFASGQRDDGILHIGLRYEMYDTRLQSFGNFEGTGASAMRLTLRRPYEVIESLLIIPELSYTLVNSTKIGSFFDIHTELLWNAWDIKLFLAHNYSSGSLEGRGDMAFLFGTKYSF